MKTNSQTTIYNLSKPLITIVTVVLNGKEFLERTINSVINQTYANIEYIIIDGGSTDGTVDIIKKYEDKIAHWISEPDRGLYDAMNKGIDLANGEWINFMNAGDIFYSNETIYEIFNNQTYNADIIYGDVKLDDSHSLRLAKPKKLKSLWDGIPLFHQSTFIRVKYHKKYKYSLDYSLSSDFDFFYEAFQENKARFKYIEIVISIFLYGGLAGQNRFKALKQNHQIINKYASNFKHNPFYFYISLFKIYLFQFLIHALSLLLPKKVFNAIRRLKRYFK